MLAPIHVPPPWGSVGQIADSSDPSREKVRQVIDFLGGVYEASPPTVKVFILEFRRRACATAVALRERACAFHRGW